MGYTELRIERWTWGSEIHLEMAWCSTLVSLSGVHEGQLAKVTLFQWIELRVVHLTMSCMWREKLSRIWLFRNFLEVVNELGGLSSSCKNQYERISMREIRDKSVHRTKRRKNFKWLVEVDTSMSMFVLNINSRASLSAKHWITKCPWPFLCLHSNFMNEKMIDKEIAHSLTAWDPSFQGWCNVCFC